MNYILQKDLPGTKAGMKFIKHEQDGSNTKYIAEDISTWYVSDVVENTPEWFLPEEEKREEARITALLVNLDNETLHVHTQYFDYVVQFRRLIHLLSSDDCSGWNDKKYTEKDLKSCFYESRSMQKDNEKEYRFYTFLSYLKYINEKYADTRKGG